MMLVLADAASIVQNVMNLKEWRARRRRKKKHQRGELDTIGHTVNQNSTACG